MPSDLKKCQFCGSDDLHTYHGHRTNVTRCMDCGARAPINMWNTRALDPALETAIEAVESVSPEIMAAAFEAGRAYLGTGPAENELKTLTRETTLAMLRAMLAEERGK